MKNNSYVTNACFCLTRIDCFFGLFNCTKWQDSVKGFSVNIWNLFRENKKIGVHKKDEEKSEFEQKQRGPKSAGGHWKYESLSPFVFDRKQYESELNRNI